MGVTNETKKYIKSFNDEPKKEWTAQDLVELGNRLLKWIDECEADPKCDVVHLSEFYAEKERIPRTIWEQNILRRPTFLPYYDLARDWILKRTMKNKDLATAYGSRFLGVYSTQLRDHELQIAKEKIDYEVQKKHEMQSALNAGSNELLQGQIQDLIVRNARLQEELDELKRQAATQHPESD